MKSKSYFKALSFIVTAMITTSAWAQEIDPMLNSVISHNNELKQQITQAKAEQGTKTTIQTPLTIFDPDGKEIERKEIMALGRNDDGTLEWISVIGNLNEGEACPTSELEELGIKVTYDYKGIVCMNVPIDAWEKLSTMSVFKTLNADRLNEISNDKARIGTKAAYVTGEISHQQSPINKYTGKGVIVGVIDIGIDFNHASFRDPVTGETRIKKALLFSGSNGSYTVIDSAKIGSYTTGTTDETHGTHTSATTAGSRIPGYEQYAGMAPEADLVLCDLSSLSTSNIIAAQTYIHDYADTVGKPVVINQSFGAHSFPNNGTGDLVNNIKNLQDEKGGFIVCNSAGNEGDCKMGIRKVFDSTRKFKTCINTEYTTKYNSQKVPIYYNLDLYVYNTVNKSFTVKFSAVDITNGDEYELDSDHGLYSSYYSGTLVTFSDEKSSSYTSGGLTYQCVNYYNYEGLYFKDPNLRLAITVVGNNGTEGTEMQMRLGYTYEDLVGSDTYSVLDGYTEGTGDGSIAFGCCSDSIISVGAWTTRQSWQALYNGYYYTFGETLNKITSFSSYGIDDNGIRRPDIIAPGSALLSAVSNYDTDFYKNKTVVSSNASINKSAKITIGSYSRDNVFAAMQGTSMSCPATTGIVALMLQANPTLTTAQVRDLLKTTADNDQYTTNTDYIPSGSLIQAGAGKVNVLAALNKLLGRTFYDLATVTTKKEKTEEVVSETADNTFAIAVSLDKGSTWYFDTDTLFNGRYSEMILSKAGTLSELKYMKGDTLYIKVVSTKSANLYNNYEISFMDADAESYSDCTPLNQSVLSRLSEIGYTNGAYFRTNNYSAVINTSEAGKLKITENHIPYSVVVTKPTTITCTMKADNNASSTFTAYPDQVVVLTTNVESSDKAHITKKQTVQGTDYNVEVTNTFSNGVITFSMPQADAAANLNASTTALTKVIPTEAETAIQAVSKLEANTTTPVILRDSKEMSFKNIKVVVDGFDESALQDEYVTDATGSYSVTKVTTPTNKSASYTMRLGYYMEVKSGIKYTTYFAPEALKLTGKDITVYKAVYNSETGELDLVAIVSTGSESITDVIIPGSTPCLIEAPESTEFLMLGGQESTQTIENNDMKGTLVTKTCSELMQANGGATIYVLNMIGSKLGFFRLKNKAIDGYDGTIGPNRAYLAIPATKSKGDDSILWNDPTGIEEISNDQSANAEANAIYNLQGIQVNDNYKGIIIQNNKKQLRK